MGSGKNKSRNVHRVTFPIRQAAPNAPKRTIFAIVRNPEESGASLSLVPGVEASDLSAHHPGDVAHFGALWCAYHFLAISDSRASNVGHEPCAPKSVPGALLAASRRAPSRQGSPKTLSVVDSRIEAHFTQNALAKSRIYYCEARRSIGLIPGWVVPVGWAYSPAICSRAVRDNSSTDVRRCETENGGRVRPPYMAPRSSNRILHEMRSRNLVLFYYWRVATEHRIDAGIGWPRRVGVLAHHVSPCHAGYSINARSPTRERNGGRVRPPYMAHRESVTPPPAVCQRAYGQSFCRGRPSCQFLRSDYNSAMPNYLRALRPGGTFFLTLVTEGRALIFGAESARTMLHDAIERCRVHHPFTLDAIVLLPDHLHILMTLPEGDGDFSVRIANVKSHFTRSYITDGGAEQARSGSRLRQRSRGVWQRRFWEHVVRDADDLRRHFDYVHYNPVKHKHVRCPHAWAHSSFHRLVAEERYERNWCCQCDGPAAAPDKIDDIARSAGE
ncbi:MAG: transposase [Phycisphaerales bacterium]|nr:transposase [Phycisphaerales bacterium]